MSKLEPAEHRWRRDTKKGPIPPLPSYHTPLPTVLSRGNEQGNAPDYKDINILRMLTELIQPIAQAACPPHRSVLHRKYEELTSLVRPGGLVEDCSEAKWMRETVRCAEQGGFRRQVAGALSIVQLRGTGEFWDFLWQQLNRRVAEKCMILVRAANETAGKQRARSLEVLRELLRMNAGLAVAFVSNGYDAIQEKFVRTPEISPAERILQGLGAPLHSTPVPVRYFHCLRPLRATAAETPRARSAFGLPLRARGGGIGGVYRRCKHVDERQMLFTSSSSPSDASTSQLSAPPETS